jgi:hypothetical protein
MVATTCSMGARARGLLCLSQVCEAVVAKQEKIIGNRSSRMVGGWASELNSQANRMRADEGQSGG